MRSSPGGWRARSSEGGPDSLLADAAANSALTPAQIASGAAVLLFGGIETTEAMIANALLMLLERPAELARARAEPEALEAAIEESLRLEPAAAVLDRYATDRRHAGRGAHRPRSARAPVPDRRQP